MEKQSLNKWQQKYIDVYYKGRMPRDKAGKQELALLGNLKSDKIRVHFSDKTEEYVITEECNMPEGKVSVEVLSSNLSLWTARGVKLEYL